MTTIIQLPVDATRLHDSTLHSRVLNYSKCGGSADPEAWFPNEPAPDNLEARAVYEETAEKLCDGCPVIAECLERAMRRETSATAWGIAGGVAPWERMRLNRNRMSRANRAAKVELEVAS